jgi:hypothetical protein
MPVDLIANGGPIINNLSDPLLKRPYWDNEQFLTNGKANPFFGKNCVTVFTGGDRKNPKNYKQQITANATTLRKDEWKALDEAVLTIARENLGGIADLRTKGLVKNIPNAMGTMIYEWDDQSDGMNAIISMDGITRAKNDRVQYQRNGIPLPIIHSDYEIIQRSLMASRNGGNGLDTTQSEQAIRRVNETLEAMLFTDTTYAYGDKDDRLRNSIYSYLNFPDRNLVTLLKSWTASDATAATIFADAQALKAANVAKNHPGPYTMYVTPEYDAVLDEDYSVSGQSVLSIRARILMLEGITEIKVNNTLTADNVVLVQMSTNVVRLLDGMPIQNIQWNVEGGMLNKYKIMTIQVPQIRSDQSGQTGLAHGTPA